LEHSSAVVGFLEVEVVVGEKVGMGVAMGVEMVVMEEEMGRMKMISKI